MTDAQDTLVQAPSGDRCAGCGAPLAADQRYCVNCGERRGRPRFVLDELAPPAAEPLPGRPPTLRQRTVSSGTALIAGVATLLLALGVGVLIGHDTAGGTGSSTPRYASAAQSPINIHVGASGGGSGSTGGSGGRGSSRSSKSKSSGASKAKVSKTVIVKANQAAQKVTGGSAKLASPTATTGSSCSAGTAGCQGGKFTGNFFGGG